MITAEYVVPGMRVRDHVVDVPLDWARPDDAPPIPLFSRELTAPEPAAADRPCLLYLQGGPGGKGPRPLTADSWLGAALRDFRVVLLDQRGTGRSGRVDGRAMRRFDTPRDAAGYLAHFRADAIVADAEHLRRTEFGGQRWATLGQSYGGFLTLTYLSRYPEALRCCYVTGGLPGIDPDAAEVYRRTYPRVAAKNAAFRRRYPRDEPLVARIADRLAAGDVRLPDGDVLTVRRFQTLGLDFGFGTGFARVHWLLDEAFDADGELSEAFLAAVGARTGFVDNPLFAAMQESIYGSGPGTTGWAARAERDRHPEFAETARPLLFTGEMMYPWMFAEIRALRPFQAAVHELARRGDWPELYDRDRLAANEVPVAAAVWYDDMFVDAGLQLDTAARVGNVHTWVTNEYEHDGLTDSRVFTHLRELLHETGEVRR